MILVASTAVGLWFGKSSVWPSLEAEWEVYRHYLSHGITFNNVHLCLTMVAYAIMPVLLPWTFAVPLIALRRPRPSLRRLCRQPGFAACLAVIVGVVIVTFGELGSAALGPKLHPDYLYRLDLALLNLAGGEYKSSLGSAVVAVWVVMGVGRMLRRGPAGSTAWGWCSGFTGSLK